MPGKRNTTLFLAIILLAAAAGWLVLPLSGGDHGDDAAPTDFNRALLREAAEKYTDPDNIADIPDEVIIEDFIDVAFTTHDWWDDYLGYMDFAKKRLNPAKKGDRLELDKKRRQRLQKQGEEGKPASEWYDRLWLYEEEAAHAFALSHWIKPIKVFVGADQWHPNAQQWPEPNLGAPRYNQWQRLVVRDQLVRLSGQVEGLTGLNVEFVDDWREANFFVQLIAPFAKSNLFRLRQFYEDPGIYRTQGPYSDLLNFEFYLKGAVRFTPESKSQVEGYFIAGNKHDIRSSVCYIWPHHTEEMLRALSTECLLRGLGLPEQARLFDEVVLGRWNRAHDAWSLHPQTVDDLGREPYDPRISSTAHGRLPNILHRSDCGAPSQFPAGYLDVIQEPVKSFCLPPPKLLRIDRYAELVDWRTDKSRLVYDFTPYDRLLLRLLYSPKLKAGMGVDDVRFAAGEAVTGARHFLAEHSFAPVPGTDARKYQPPQDASVPALDASAQPVSDLVRDFLTVTSLDGDWQDGYWRYLSRPWKVPDAVVSNKTDRYKGDWRITYSVRQAPDPGLITRWEKPVRVSLFGPFNRGGGHLNSNREDLRLGVASQIEKYVAAFTPELSEATGLDIAYLPSLGENAVPSPEANLHIVPVFLDASNVFKEFRTNQGPWEPFHGRFGEIGFKGAVRFTPEQKTQVEGYLVLAEDGTIDRAVCKIWWNHAPPMVRALVTECLVRAMGLPKTSRLVSDSVVSHWNSAHDRYSRMPLKGWDWTDYGPQYVRLESLGQWQRIVEARTDHDALPTGLTGHDRLLLQTLYSPALQPGMTDKAALEEMVRSLMEE